MKTLEIPVIQSCKACIEAAELVNSKVKNGEHITLVLVNVHGAYHCHAPISTVQFEKMNRQYILLK